MDNNITQITKADCAGCGACAAVCPISCVAMEEKLGFFYPVVNTEKCIQCGKCLKACAVNGEEILRNTPQAWYAGYIEPSQMSRHSTSGGICTALSRLYIQQGYPVYGAVFTKNWDLVHRRVKGVEELEQFSGSKYLQSSVSPEVYEGIEELLKQGKNCLFIGTPCQCGGLANYLTAKNVPTETLLTVDFMCHGVPSPVLGKKFITYLQSKSQKKITYYNFRSKAYGWGGLDRELEYADGSAKVVSAALCPLHRWFGKHLSLRESCFSCRYRTKNRAADITVADFWGLEKYYPELPSKQGVCAIQVNSSKGDRAYKMLLERGGMVGQVVTEQSVWDRKTALANFPKPEDYEAFQQAASVLPVENLIKKFPSITTVDRIKSTIKLLLGLVR